MNCNSKYYFDTMGNEICIKCLEYDPITLNFFKSSIDSLLKTKISNVKDSLDSIKNFNQKGAIISHYLFHREDIAKKILYNPYTSLSLIDDWLKSSIILFFFSKFFSINSLKSLKSGKINYEKKKKIDQQLYSFLECFKSKLFVVSNKPFSEWRPFKKNDGDLILLTPNKTSFSIFKDKERIKANDFKIVMTDILLRNQVVLDDKDQEMFDSNIVITLFRRSTYNLNICLDNQSNFQYFYDNLKQILLIKRFNPETQILFKNFDELDLQNQTFLRKIGEEFIKKELSLKFFDIIKLKDGYAIGVNSLRFLFNALIMFKEKGDLHKWIGKIAEDHIYTLFNGFVEY